MLRSETLSVALRTSFERAWALIADPANLHRWTVGFALAPPRPAGRPGVWLVETPRGPLEVFVRCEEATGVIDFHFGRDGAYRCSPSRLVRQDGGVLYVFTQFEPPGAPEGLFEKLVENVREEFRILRQLLEVPIAEAA